MKKLLLLILQVMTVCILFTAFSIPSFAAIDATTNLTATPLSSSQIRLNWTAPTLTGASKVEGYAIYVNSQIKAYTNSETLEYIDVGLTPNTTYLYYVVAYGGSEYGPWGQQVQSTTPFPADGLIPSLSAVATGTNQIVLKWTRSTEPGVTGYKIYRDEVSIESTGTINYNSTDQTYEFTDSTGLTSGIQYSYKVSTIGGDNLRESGIVAVATKYEAPSVPGQFNVVLSSVKQALLSWTASTGVVTGYAVYKNEILVKTFDYVEGLASYTYTDTSLLADTTYTYYVKAYNSTTWGSKASDTSVVTSIVLTTASAAAITSTGAAVAGNVTSDGGSAITERGVVYSTTSNPTTLNSKVTVSGTTGEFTANLTGLGASTTYYARAYAKNDNEGIKYGNEITFKTLAPLAVPTITTDSTATAITVSSATVGGNVVATGGASISQRGIVYGTSHTPTTAGLKITVAGTTGAFTANLSGLAASTIYYARAYAINSQGTGYGNEITFITSAVVSAPTVTTSSSVTSISSTGATAGGNVTSDGGVAISERGIVYGTSTGPTTAGLKVAVSGTTGAFTANLTGLDASTTYYIKAYAINNQETSYGSEATFSTLAALSIPTVTTTSVTSITSATAASGGNVIVDGGDAVTERGIVYSTSSNPTTANTKVTAGGTTGSFTANMAGLTASTVYYVKAYAINGEGTAYGNEVTFTTSAATAPTATGVSITGILTVGQTLTGNYTYSDAELDPEGATTFRWLKSSDGTSYSAIVGATSRTYILQSGDSGKYLKFEVTPKSTVAPTNGIPVLSAAKAIGNAPTASGLNVTGVTRVGQTLTGNYIFNDADGDSEGASIFKWLRASSSGGTYTEISGATSTTYVLQNTDMGKYIKFEVTPASVNAPSLGSTNRSSATSVILGNDNANLSDLVVTSNTLVPVFDPAILNYTLTVANDVYSVVVTPTAQDTNAAVVIVGHSTPEISLNEGSNPVDIAVTSQDGNITRTYNIVITRTPLPNANTDLDGLVLSNGTLNQVNATSYTADVAYTTTSVTVTATVYALTSTIKVNGVLVLSASASQNISLNVGPNTISVEVTAESGDIRVYSIVVTRAPSDNAYLSNLTLSTGTLSPVFDKTVLTYKTGVLNDISAITVTPTVEDQTATVSFKRNGTDSTSTIALVAGGTVEISVIVTAGDGTTKTYIVNVSRGPAAPVTTFSFDVGNPRWLMNTTSMMEYSVNGGSIWGTCDEGGTDLSAKNITAAADVKVRFKANGDIPDGNVQIHDILAGPAAPNFSAANSLNDTLTGLPANATNIEGRVNSGVWVTLTVNPSGVGTGLTFDPGNTVDIRVKATGLVLTGTLATQAAQDISVLPIASNVSISGTLKVGQTLTGNYTFYDPSGNPDASTFRWLIYNSSTGLSTPIAGETGSTYLLKLTDKFKRIMFEVTPKTSTETGTPIQYITSTAVAP